jgi:hypothetical protein
MRTVGRRCNRSLSSQAYVLWQTYKFVFQQPVLLQQSDSYRVVGWRFVQFVSLTNQKFASRSAVGLCIELLHILEHIPLRSVSRLSSSLFRLSFRCSLREVFLSMWCILFLSVSLLHHLSFRNIIQWYSLAGQKYSNPLMCACVRVCVCVWGGG